MWCANQEQGIDIVTPGGLILKGTYMSFYFQKQKFKEKSFHHKNNKNGVKVNLVINQELF